MFSLLKRRPRQEGTSHQLLCALSGSRTPFYSPLGDGPNVAIAKILSAAVAAAAAAAAIATAAC